jgi:hypothetical protein
LVIMTTSPGLEYQAALPPEGATCDGDRCRSVALVRLIVPRPKIAGDDHAGPLAVWEMCDLHWPSLRWACENSGHPVTDTTGSLRGVAAEFPTWNVWCSDGGRLYAATYTGGPDGPHGITVDAWLAGQLRAKMRAVMASQWHHI